jgi:hypothetical protein
MTYDQLKKLRPAFNGCKVHFPRYQFGDGSRRAQDMTGIYENTPRIRTKTCVIFSGTIFLLHYILYKEAASPCETSITTYQHGVMALKA